MSQREESHSLPCIRLVNTYTVDAGGFLFSVTSSVITQMGWRAVYGVDEKERPVIPVWRQGEIVCFTGAELQQGQTKPKPLHTEGTLLVAMETCGKDIDDEAQREAIKDSGIGTPSTRAGIIEMPTFRKSRSISQEVTMTEAVMKRSHRRPFTVIAIVIVSHVSILLRMHCSV